MPRKTALPLSPLGAKIDTIRESKNIALTQVAPAAKLHYTQLYRIMHGLSRPSVESLKRICKALHCTPQETAEIFALTPYRAPSADELEEERPSRKTVAA